jgi:hypothetical protein
MNTATRRERNRIRQAQRRAAMSDEERAAVREQDARTKREARAADDPSAALARERKRSPAYRAATNAARATPAQRAKSRVHMARYRARPESKQQDRARMKVREAIKYGRLAKPSTCQRCGQSPARGRDGRSLLRADHWHGYDDAHALDVQWICARCDGEVERERAHHRVASSVGVRPAAASRSKTTAT